jgi:trk system potassium uptake protein TrkA
MKFCVIGLGRFGYQLAMSLSEHGNEVLAVDKSEATVDDISDHVTQAVCTKIIDEESLTSIGVENIDTAIVCVGEDFAQSTLITALLKRGLKVQTVIARAMNKIHENILTLVGADKVISLEREMAIRLAEKLSMPLGDLVHITNDFATAQIQAPAGLIGKSLKEVCAVKKLAVACIAVKKGNEMLLVSPEYIIMDEDILLFAGNRKALNALVRL